MKKIITLSLALSFIYVKSSYSQKTVGECTIQFNISTDDSLNVKMNETKKLVYIKGNEVRSEFVSPVFCQTTFYTQQTGNVVILRDLNNNKFMTKLDKKKWDELNEDYQDLEIISSNEKASILGYDCNKVILKLKKGEKLEVYYAINLRASVPEFEYPFKSIPGLVLKYESIGSGGKGKVTFTATKINFNPIPPFLFSIPVSGYRII